MSLKPNELPALEAAERIRTGSLTSEALVSACLERIDETDDSVGAWQWLNADGALAQAREMDRIRKAGKPLGTLHGVPVGVKDIIDTKGIPTECGSPVLAGRKPRRNAFLIDRLNDAGAVMLGKTVTTEFAFMNPARTANPHDATRTPGGSSSGSAASVADCQVPLAIGSQTNGSVVRPASFCGTFGFKPTRGAISVGGMLQTCRSLDQVGVFARTLEDSAALADAVSGHDSRDAKSHSRPKPCILSGCRMDVPVEPTLAWFEPSYFDLLEDGSRQGMEDLIDLLGKQVERIPVPEGFDELIELHRIIQEFELNQSLGNRIRSNQESVSTALIEAVERGSRISEVEYGKAISGKIAAEQYFDVFFWDYDAIIAPSSRGEAPLLAFGTGDPLFCTAWTLCGLPALSMPMLTGSSDLPVGVQLIGMAEQDDRLFRTARWLLDEIIGSIDGKKGRGVMQDGLMKVAVACSATLLFAGFLLGLAYSISTGFAGFWGGLPFWIITLFVLSLAGYDAWDEGIRKLVRRK